MEIIYILCYKYKNLLVFGKTKVNKSFIFSIFINEFLNKSGNW